MGRWGPERESKRVRFPLWGRPSKALQGAWMGALERLQKGNKCLALLYPWSGWSPGLRHSGHCPWFPEPLHPWSAGRTFIILLAPEHLATGPHPEWQAWEVEASWKTVDIWFPTLALPLSCGAVRCVPHLCEPHSGLGAHKSSSSPVPWRGFQEALGSVETDLGLQSFVV